MMTDENNVRLVVKTLSLRAARDAREVTLFEREANILKHLSHPAIPRLLEYAVEESDTGDIQMHLVQSYVAEKSLEQWVRAGRSFSTKEATLILAALADVLVALHGTSPPLVHRDIKPANVMQGEGGDVFLVDFGAAKNAAGDGTAVGTFGYMAPEQMEGRSTPASDIFGVGMTMISVLTHREPESFAEDGGVRRAWRSCANVDDPLAQLLDECIALEEGRRPKDGFALRERLRELDRGVPSRRLEQNRARATPRPSLPKRPFVAGLILSVLVGVVPFFVIVSSKTEQTTGTSSPRPSDVDVPSPPAVPTTPLRHRQVTASERLGAPGMIEATHCLARARRALSSEERYRSWRKGDAAPTCEERYVSYGLYPLYEDAPDICQEAAEAAATSMALRAASEAISQSLMALTKTAAEASSYYESQEYRDDQCAKGIVLHQRLLPEYAAVRNAYADVLSARRALLGNPHPTEEAMKSYREVLDAAVTLDDPALPVTGRADAVERFARALSATPAQVIPIGANVPALKKWSRGSNELGAQMAAELVGSSTASAIHMRLIFE